MRPVAPARRHPALAKGVLNVVFLRASKEMARAHTCAVVAMVAGIEIIECAVLQLIGIAMGINLATVSYSEESVTPVGDIAKPFPASRSFLHLAPKSFNWVGDRATPDMAEVRTESTAPRFYQIRARHERHFAVRAHCCLIGMFRHVSAPCTGVMNCSTAA